MTEQSVNTHQFEADVTQVLSLVVNSLYSNAEIFLRELISNSSDALDKLRFEAISSPELTADDTELKIRLIPDKEAGTLTVWDNGNGMSEAELIENLGTIARSGSRAFIDQLKDAQLKDGKSNDLNLIGQFGVGFYSAFLVADRVEVITRKAGTDEAFRWESDAKETFTVSPAERELRGTSVILHLSEDKIEYADVWRLRQLITRYSDYVEYPIELQVEKDPTMDIDSEPDDDADDGPTLEFETVNEGSALWRRSADAITDEQYEEFYKHITKDWEPPLSRTHFQIEGAQLFTGLLFIPSRRPFDLFDREHIRGLRLYVKRVFIMDEAEVLLPQWLRFVRGLIDSDDMPLNVSRELLQDSRLVKTIRKQVVKKVLDLLSKMADDEPEEYEKFWDNFGVVLKEGLYFAPDQHKRLGELVRFDSSAQSETTSLKAYVERMKEDQTAIYYAIGASRALVETSPHIEALKQREYEILYLTDPVDQWAVEGLREYDGKQLVSAMHADLKLDDIKGDDSDEDDADPVDNTDFFDAMKEVLSDRVASVEASKRLTDSPACLVVPEGGMPAHIERLMRAQQPDAPNQQRILEINPTHPIIQGMERLHASDSGSEKLRDWIELIYDQALLSEGSPIDDPGRFTATLNALLQNAVETAVSSD